MFGLLLKGRKGAHLEGGQIFLRPPRGSDFREWSSLRAASRAFLEPWEPLWSPGELSRSAWRHRLRQYRAEASAGTGHYFFIFERGTGRLAGGVSLVNIRRGVAQSAQIGYWMGEAFAGRGYMIEALGLVERYCFETLRLHRIEAACIPENARSAHVLEKAGFVREGLMRSYLRINGSWRDHVLYALIADQDRATLKSGQRV